MLDRLGKLYGSDHEAVLILPDDDGNRVIVSVWEGECRIALERTWPEQLTNPGARRVTSLCEVLLTADELTAIVAAGPDIIAALGDEGGAVLELGDHVVRPCPTCGVEVAAPTLDSIIVDCLGCDARLVTCVDLDDQELHLLPRENERDSRLD